jgi:hypothetical protein
MSELRQRHLAESSSPAESQTSLEDASDPVDWKKDKEDTLSYGKTPEGKGKEGGTERKTERFI